MLKIFDQLWFIKSTGGSSDLSYMTYFKDDSAFKKRKATGLGWASRSNPNEQGEIVNNDLVQGFEVVASVSRWSTQNKLFRMRDPRGFVVEIPSGNLAKLIACTTITNGVIQDKCVWGRDGQDHLLIPEQSNLYQEARVNMAKLSKNIALKDVAVGEVVEISRGGTIQKRIYIGQCKSIHSGQAHRRSGSYFGGSKHTVATFDAFTETKWWHCFSNVANNNTKIDHQSIYISQSRTATVVSRTGQQLDMDLVAEIRHCMRYNTSTEAVDEFEQQLETDRTVNNRSGEKLHITAILEETIWK
jgi:hypothetical protein